MCFVFELRWQNGDFDVLHLAVRNVETAGRLGLTSENISHSCLACFSRLQWSKNTAVYWFVLLTTPLRCLFLNFSMRISAFSSESSPPEASQVKESTEVLCWWWGTLGGLRVMGGKQRRAVSDHLPNWSVDSALWGPGLPCLVTECVACGTWMTFLTRLCV